MIPVRREWSIGSGFGSACLDNEWDIPAEIGWERFGIQPLGNSGGVISYSGKFNQPAQIRSVPISSQPIMILSLNLAGKCQLSSAGAGMVTQEANGYSLVLANQSDKGLILEHEHRVLNKAMTFLMTQDHLRATLVGMRLPKLIDSFLNDRADNTITGMRMAGLMRQACSQIQSNPYSGDLSTLYLNGRMTDVLVALLGDCAGGAEWRKPTVGAERAKVAVICEILLASLANIPTQEVLAREVGLSQRRLADVFRDVTGLTVLEWVVEKKLVLASELLREGSLSVKEITHRVGYSHRSTFAAAFTRRFGIAPASYRSSALTIHFISP